MKLFEVKKSNNKIQVGDKWDYFFYFSINSKLEDKLLKAESKYDSLEITEENRLKLEEELNSIFEKWFSKNGDKNDSTDK